MHKVWGLISSSESLTCRQKDMHLRKSWLSYKAWWDHSLFLKYEIFLPQWSNYKFWVYTFRPCLLCKFCHILCFLHMSLLPPSQARCPSKLSLSSWERDIKERKLNRGLYSHLNVFPEDYQALTCWNLSLTDYHLLSSLNCFQQSFQRLLQLNL